MDTIFILKSTKGHYSIKNVGEVMVLVLYTLSDDAFDLYSKGFRVIEETQFL